MVKRCGLRFSFAAVALACLTAFAGGIDDAAWIGEPKEAPPPRFLRFSCPFEGSDAALDLEVSADQRYILLLDGKVVGRGPDSGDVKHWHSRKMTLRPGRGDHLLEAVVWSMDIVMEKGRTVDRFANDRPFAHLTWRTGFALKAEGEYDRRLTTGTAAWKYAPLEGTVPIGRGANSWAFGVGSQFEVTGTSVLGERPPEDRYVPATELSPKGGFNPARVARGGVTPRGRRTFTSILPEQLSRTARPGEMPKPMALPPHAAVTNVFDLGDYYCAYPILRVSGGRGARLTWGWTEALRDPKLLAEGKDYGKANRDRREGMVFSDDYALVDVFRPDGRADALFTTPWWRCGRWCRLVVETADEPLTIADMAIDETRYPAENEGSFEAEGDDSLEPIARMSVRGLQSCMHELMFDCPFWEQAMYGGDIRVSFLGVAAMTRDDRLVKHCLRILDDARGADGYIPMNWPSINDQHSTTWLLSWIVAIGDYALWHDDRRWLEDRLAGVEHSLHGVARYENGRGLLENAWGWNYLDWVADWERDYAVPPGASYGKGESSALNLLYLLAMQKTAVALEACGESERAAYWRGRAGKLSRTIHETFMDGARGILADTPAKTSFCEHAQALAILTGCVDGPAAERALQTSERGEGMAMCSSFFLHYLFEACAKMGRGDLILKKLDCWRRYVALGLKCPLESEFFPRSDCHGFGAHPLFHFHAGLAGVTPAAPFFGKVRVAPSPGGLRRIRAKTPHPRGFVETDLSFRDGTAEGFVTLPAGVAGAFVWNGVERPLVPGRNEIGGTRTKPIRIGAVNCGAFHYGTQTVTPGEYAAGWEGLARDKPADVFFYEDVGTRAYPERAMSVPGLDIRAVVADGKGEVSVVELPRTLEVGGQVQKTPRYRALRIVRDWNGGRIAFYGVHLVAEGHIRGPKPPKGEPSLSQRLRREQFKALIADAKAFDHAVLAGDFNAQKASEYDVFKEAGFALANCSDEYGTVATLRKIPADNIVVSPGLAIAAFEVPHYYRLDTDHHPVIATIDLADEVAKSRRRIPTVADYLKLPRDERMEWFANGEFRKRMFEANYPDGDGVLSRWVRVEKIPNLRDVGGLPTADGTVLKRGLLFRSAGWNDNAKTPKGRPESEWSAGRSRLTEKGRRELSPLGIRTELDLRSSGECWGMKGSPLGPDVRWINVPFGHYVEIERNPKCREAVRQAFCILADERNYPLVFHCIGGADRTGCLALMVEALCGVDEETCLKDWELTGCYTARLNLVHEKTIGPFLDSLAKRPGRTFEERMRVFLAECGVPESQMETVRRIMRSEQSK